MVKLKIACPHFDICSGCVYNDTASDPAIFKRAKLYLEKVLGKPLALQKGDAKYFRTRAKLAVRPNKNDPKRPLIGLFEEGTHRVVPIPNCQIHAPEINKVVQVFLEEFRRANLSVYDEETHSGDLRYMQCIVERRTKKVLVCFVVSFDEESLKRQEWEHFAKNLFENKTFFHSIWLNFQPKAQNAIFGSSTQHVIGQRDIWENICGKELAFGPVHFGQANLYMFEELVKTIRKHMPKNKEVLELYAGTGSIGLTLVDVCKKVTFFERDKNAIDLFEKSYERMCYVLQKRSSYHTDSSENSQQYIDSAEVVIVDPPRKGLSKEVLGSILSSKTTQDLVYVSCDYETFERDARQLWQARDGFYLHKAFCYLFFPGSNHIETLGFFHRKH